MARVRGARSVFTVAVTAMLTVAVGAAIAQDETLLPPSLDEEGTILEGLEGEETDVGASPEEASLPPTPSLASEGISVSGDPTSGYATPDGTRVPAGAVSSGGLARLPATGGA
jgi:hypothetical protein